MKNIGVIPNLLKDKDLSMTKLIVNWLQAHDFNIYLTPKTTDLLQSKVQSVEEDILYKKCDAVIAIGGDGTILSVAQKASIADVPIIGVNLGRLGFLADVDSNKVIPLLEKLITKDYTIEERAMLQATIIDPAGEKHIFHALNDVSMTRGGYSRLTEFEIATS